ncbi:MAG: hypothetical protein LBJ08_12850 [Bifidobacteriaceae bacterium]|jgi:DNA adenine methylase|nr:hypothetical protein [Bifidobacteriaceae bacterium]
MNAFTARDHEALARVIDEVSRAAWFMTYDVSPLIEELYREHFQRAYSLNYSSHHPGRTSEMLIASPEAADALLRVVDEA